MLCDKLIKGISLENLTPCHYWFCVRKRCVVTCESLGKSVSIHYTFSCVYFDDSVARRLEPSSHEWLIYDRDNNHLEDNEEHIKRRLSRSFVRTPHFLPYILLALQSVLFVIHNGCDHCLWSQIKLADAAAAKSLARHVAIAKRTFFCASSIHAVERTIN